MEHNKFFANNEHLALSNELFISWLGPADLNTPGLGWHFTVNGELFLLQKLQNHSYQVVNDIALRPSQLNQLSDVERYIHAAVKMAHESGSLLKGLRQFSDAICFAIYPGFGIGANNSTENEDLLTVFYNALETYQPGNAGRILTNCVFDIATSSKQAQQYVSHCLKYIPAQFSGIICAYGLVSRSLWGSRQQAALIEGWRYQLRNPTQPYTNNLHQWGSSTPKVIIERDLRPEDKSALLAATGLTEQDLALAMTIAELSPEQEVGKYATTLLSFLGMRSNLAIPRENVPDISSLGNIID